MAITHSKVSGIGDGGDTTLVRPVDWNAAHTGQPTSISDFLDDTAGGTDALVTKAPTSNALYDAMRFTKRNIIINGGFTINQRGYASAAALTNYGHDRWKAGAGGGAYSFTQLASPTTITIAANKTLIQVIEDKMVYGGTYILSWTGTCQARYAINSATPAGAYADSPITITGQTAGTTMSVEFGLGASAGTLGLVQLELGSVATPFEFRLYALELELCQRYLVMFGGIAYEYVGVGVGASTTTAYALCFLPVSMRSNSPTVSYPDVTKWGIFDGVNLIALTALAYNNGGFNNINLLCTVAAGVTVNHPWQLIGDSAATARLYFSAEL